MSLARAIEILNARKQHGHSGWYLSGDLVWGTDQYEYFEPFEAIAIAEKYEREDNGATS